MSGEKVLGLITTNYGIEEKSKLILDRPLAALSFLGRYRLIDFPLSNMVNMGIRTVGVILSHNYRSLSDHLGSGGDWQLDRKRGGIFLMPGAPRGVERTDVRFLVEDFINNSIIFNRSKADYVICSASNVVYNMDYQKLVDAYRESGADIEIVSVKAKADNKWLTKIEFDENDSSRVAGMEAGVKKDDYAFLDCFITSLDYLKKSIIDKKDELRHDDLFKALFINNPQANVRCYELDENTFKASIFSVQQYFDRSRELLELENYEALFSDERPVFTKTYDTEPAIYNASAQVNNSLVSAGCVVAGTVENSILSRGVVVEEGAVVRNSIIMHDCIIRSGAQLEYAIIDRWNKIEGDAVIKGTPTGIIEKEKGYVWHDVIQATAK